MADDMWICDAYLDDGCVGNKKSRCVWQHTRNAKCLNIMYRDIVFLEKNKINYPCGHALWSDNVLIKIERGSDAYKRLQDRDK